MSDSGKNDSGQGNVVPLFATPFAAVNTGTDREFNSRLANLCDSQRAVGATPARTDFLGLADPAAGELRQILLNQSTSVVAALSDMPASEFSKLKVQARGWSLVVPRNEHVPCQHFTGASWLAVYCAQAGEADEGSTGAGVLRFHERRLGSIFRDASTAVLKAPFRHGNHTWTPQAGGMALFPAHVAHEVSVVRSDTSLILVFALIRFTEAGR